MPPRSWYSKTSPISRRVLAAINDSVRFRQSLQPRSEIGRFADDVGLVPVWRVLRLSAVESRFEALHASFLSPLVGRDEEIDLLLRRWARAKASDGQVVLISGEPGIGKSRITAALAERFGKGATVRAQGRHAQRLSSAVSGRSRRRPAREGSTRCRPPRLDHGGKRSANAPLRQIRINRIITWRIDRTNRAARPPAEPAKRSYLFGLACCNHGGVARHSGNATVRHSNFRQPSFPE